MFIVEKQKNSDGFHSFEDQPWRSKNWMGDDWLEAPEHLHEAIVVCQGYCDLAIENGVLIGVIPRPCQTESRWYKAWRFLTGRN